MILEGIKEGEGVHFSTSERKDKMGMLLSVLFGAGGFYLGTLFQNWKTAKDEESKEYEEFKKHKAKISKGSNPSQ